MEFTIVSGMAAPNSNVNRASRVLQTLLSLVFLLQFLFPDAKDPLDNDNKEEETDVDDTDDQDNKYSELLKVKQ